MAAWVWVLAGLAWADEAADAVVQQAREANRVDSSIQTLKMTIISKKGSTREKELIVRSKRDGDIIRSTLELTSPSLEAGVKVLMVDHPDKADEQSMYLPADKPNRKTLRQPHCQSRCRSIHCYKSSYYCTHQ